MSNIEFQIAKTARVNKNKWCIFIRNNKIDSINRNWFLIGNIPNDKIIIEFQWNLDFSVINAILKNLPGAKLQFIKRRRNLYNYVCFGDKESAKKAIDYVEAWYLAKTLEK